MKEITVYQREIADGVAEAVRSQASIAFCNPAALVEIGEERDSLVQKIVAENKDQMDLYYLESILVSTNWNANDDVFLAEPTWAARHTPEDKPFNYMHDEDDIIGHMTGSYVVDRNGNRVEADSDDSHPDDFDIVTRVVLYKSWANPENADRMTQIIADLEGDEEKWFVSMECLFAGFDYAVQDKSGNRSIIARNEESAFLTRHLRSYGGTGEYDGFKIGRALRNISFSGQGLVSNPANKGSRILKPNATVAFIPNSTLTIGENKMADITKEQYDALKVELSEAKDALKAVQAEMEAAKAKEIADQIKAHEAEISEKDSSIADLTEKVSALETEAKESKDALKASEDALAKYKEEMEEMKKKEKEEKRKAALVEAGVEADKALETVASLDALDDDAFAGIVELYATKKAEASSEEDGDADEGDDDVDDASASDALDGTDTDESALAGNDDEDVDETRLAVASFIADSMNISLDSDEDSE